MLGKVCRRDVLYIFLVSVFNCLTFPGASHLMYREPGLISNLTEKNPLGKNMLGFQHSFGNNFNSETSYKRDEGVTWQAKSDIDM